MTDLKNNKRRKKEEAIGHKTAGYRRIIGRIKSVSANSIGRSSDACMRIKLQDVKDIETKGRWWKVGAKWRGNQFHNGNGEAEDGVGASTSSVMRKKSAAEREEDALLVLASKYRMNTDLRRSIFCIIMGSMDCEDAFEKLVRGGMLKGKAERDVIRVLAECCSQEKSYNPYYAHLATRICEYQPSCNFTFRLTYWDAFKQFDKMKPRKAANLAKLLAHLLTNERGLNLNVLRVIDIDSRGMPEQTIIFLMVLFTTLFESFDDPLQMKGIFERAVSNRKKRKRSTSIGDDDELVDDDGGEGMKESISLFLLHYLKPSPKNTKKSTFRANFKAALKACETDDF
jgi:nucleolar MIF4G domain-containing protein 1